MSKKENKIWKYFSNIDDNNKLAKCDLCGKNFSFKSTSNNLRTHLKHRHPNSLSELLCSEGDVTVKREDEDSLGFGQQSSEIWDYFEQETGGRVRCVVCRASRSNNTDDMKNHLAEKHPKLLNGTNQVLRSSDPLIRETAASDESGNEDDGTYTEVIYLEEDAKKKTPKYIIKETKTRSEPKKIKRIEKKQRRVSGSSDDMPIKRRKQDTPNEIDTFLTYIKCLLSQVPSEVCTKLQLDIVNLIMKAKLSRGVVNESIVLDNSMNVARQVNVDRTDVISVAFADTDIAPITESTDHCYEDVKDNN